MTWLALIISLPTATATARMRTWRALKQSGCAVPRDGVYLLPAEASSATVFSEQAQAVRAAGGIAYVAQISRFEAEDEQRLVTLFDRSQEYIALIERAALLQRGLPSVNASALRRNLRNLQRDLNAVAAIDFFPSPVRAQAIAAVADVAAAAERILTRDEPQAIEATIERVDPALFQRRTWATRKNMWIDRVASAWLIRRFIDVEARFLWLDKPSDCPADVLGFDFDGARFTHVGTRVTFEVLLASFGLSDAALDRIAAAVHYLDIGGLPADDAAGIEAIIRGAKWRFGSDDQLLEHAADIFDDFYASYSNDN